MTPLHVAAKYRQMNTFHLIFDSVVDKFPRNISGKTPFDLMLEDVETPKIDSLQEDPDAKISSIEGDPLEVMKRYGYSYYEHDMSHLVISLTPLMINHDYHCLQYVEYD